MAPKKMGDQKESLPQGQPQVEATTSSAGYSGLRRMAPEATGKENEGLPQTQNPFVEDATLAVRYSWASGDPNTTNEHGTLNGFRRLPPEAMGIDTRLPQANSQVKDAILAIGSSGVPDDANTASEHWKISMEGVKLRIQRREAYDEQMEQLNGLRRLEPQPALPEFNPEEAGADALAWCELVDIFLCEHPLQSDALIAALNNSLKGSASVWLPQVTYEGMTWAEFKINFLACYGSENTCAASMISINKSRPKENESYTAYASRLVESFVNKWKSLTPEQIAISFVLAHISQFDSRVQRMAHTTEIMTRERLVQELNEFFNLKHKLEPDPAENTDVPEKRTRSVPVQRPARKCKNTKIKTPTPTKTKRATATKSKPATATATSSKLAGVIPGICYFCGKEDHHTLNCPKPRSSALRDPGPSGLSDPAPSGLPEPGPSGLWLPGPSGLSDPGPSGLPKPGPSALSNPGTNSLLEPGHSALSVPGPSALSEPVPSGMSDPGPTGFIKTATPRKTKRATATKCKPTTATATSSKLANTIPEICYLCGKEGHHINICPKPSTRALRDPGPSALSEPGPRALWLPEPSSISDPGPSGLQDPGPSCMSKPGRRALSAQGPSDQSEPGTSRETLDDQRHSNLKKIGCVCCGLQPLVGTSQSHSGLSSTDNIIYIEIDADENQNLHQTNEENKSTEKYAEDMNQNVITKVEDKATDVYTELVLLEQYALVANTEEIECGICMDSYQPGQGVVLRECLHTFCQECLSDLVKHSEEPVVMCPAMDCSEQLQQREIRALVPPDVHEQWLAKGLATAESGTQDAFHCQTRDCQGWAMCDPGVTRFHCPVCNIVNCVTCKAIHEGETCSDYRARLNPDETTETYLKDMLSRGEAMRCPTCSVIITKQVGCDFIKCAACKTEICWATRGPRWGPRGRGDTSGGCRCNFNRKKCHPSCQNCH